MQLHVYKYTLFILLVLSYEDIKTKTIKISSIFLFILSLLQHKLYIYSGIIAFIILGLLYIIKNKEIGEGDVILISLCSLSIPIHLLGYFFTFIGLISGLTSKLLEIKTIALVPFITMAFLLVKVIEYCS